MDVIQEFKSNVNSSFTIFDHITNYELSSKAKMSNALPSSQTENRLMIEHAA